jgi:hypothetical protein
MHDDVSQLRVFDTQITLEVAGERVGGGESRTGVGRDRQQRDRTHPMVSAQRPGRGR